MSRRASGFGTAALAVAFAATFGPPSARADEPAAGDPAPPGAAAAMAPASLKLTLFGEPTGDRALEPTIAVLPLRLSLLGDAFPIGPALGGDPCASREDPSGNSVHGFPLLRQSYVPVTSHLVIQGFSRAGCPLDAGVGAGLTYAIALPKNLWLVASAGGFVQPGVPGGLTGRGQLHTDARVDLLLRKTPDSALSLGVGRRGIALTGLW